MSEERVALVTGAARGIGAAVALRLAADGLRVVAVDSCAGVAPDTGAGYPLAGPAQLAEIGERLGDRGVTVAADVRDRGALAAAVARAHADWGRLDVAVAAAAIVAGGRPLWEDDSLGDLLDVDVVGVWNTAAVTVPAMLAGPDPARCRFVAIASAAGQRGLFHLTAYCSAKHAVVGLVRGLAADLVGTGVTACAVAPGGTRTAMLDATAELYGVAPADLAGNQLLRDLLDPAELAEVVALCCSDAGRSLNGAVVAADGGFG
ncbi:mycofactocin-coupled SDR family oxidoreductase [Nocardioides sp. R1-1]|uniref:mycofactocin-coupled SDR family oxidoreductase n=1 Tax=Nocardioides sp. R1-1 TaxID=3383502 RepID=UPI0038D16818